jgi:hypothetical protein
MEKQDATQRNDVSADGKLAGTPGKYALLEPYMGKRIGDIFRTRLRSAGALQVFQWSEIGIKPLRPLLQGMGIDPETTRYRVDFIKAEHPLSVGYYQLMGIRPLLSSEKREKDIKETTLAEFIYNYAMSQWRAIGTGLEKVSIKPNGGGKYEAAFHITQKNGVLLVAVSWINVSEEEAVAS